MKYYEDNLRKGELTSDRMNKQWEEKEVFFNIKIENLEEQIGIMRSGQDCREND